jgi:hypothetical protein
MIDTSQPVIISSSGDTNEDTIDKDDYVAFGRNEYAGCSCPVDQTFGLTVHGNPLARTFDDRLRTRFGVTVGLVRKDVAADVWKNIIDNLDDEIMPGSNTLVSDQAQSVYETVF